MPARPLVFILGLLLCAAGVVTCATGAVDSLESFPTLADGLLLGGLLLTVLGVAGKAPRGRQMLGRRAPRERDDA